MNLKKLFLKAALLPALLSTAQLGHAADETSAKSPPPSAAPAAKANDELDITGEKARDRRNAAYTLAPGQWGIRVGLLGTGGEELYGALGVDYGFKHGFQLGINLLHASAGMLNLALKWNFLETGPWAFSAQFAPVWIHGDWVWLSSGNQVIGNIDVLAFPLGMTSSYTPNEWLQFDLSAGYTDVELFGDLHSESLIFDTHLAMRQIRLKPTARLHIKKRLSLYFTATVPVWTQIPGSIEADIIVAPGVVAGGRSSGSLSPSFGELYLLTLGARSMISRSTFINFALNYGSITERLYGNPLYPKLGLEFRF